MAPVELENPAVILRRHGLSAKHSWGQNFLGNAHALERIADSLGLKEGDTVVELGPGLGHLTCFLVATGANVVAIERDNDMIGVLQKELVHPRFRVAFGNAAESKFAEVAGVPSIVLCGNLPYHLTSSILFQLLDQQATVERAAFTLQKEVAERIAAEPGGRAYGLLSVLLGRFYALDLLFVLRAAEFHPPPAVDSAVIRLTRLPFPQGEVTSEARFIRVVKAAFAHRRKTVLNSLQSDKTLGSVEALRAALEGAGVDPKARAETLSPVQFAAIEKRLPVPTP